MNAKTFITDYGFNRTTNPGINLPAFLVNAFQSYIRWTAQRKAIRQLRSLDDHMLQDIGVTRGDIEHVVRP